VDKWITRYCQLSCYCIEFPTVRLTLCLFGGTNNRRFSFDLTQNDGRAQIRLQLVIQCINRPHSATWYKQHSSTTLQFHSPYTTAIVHQCFVHMPLYYSSHRFLTNLSGWRRIQATGVYMRVIDPFTERTILRPGCRSRPGSLYHPISPVYHAVMSLTLSEWLGNVLCAVRSLYIAGLWIHLVSSCHSHG